MVVITYNEIENKTRRLPQLMSTLYHSFQFYDQFCKKGLSINDVTPRGKPDQGFVQSSYRTKGMTKRAKKCNKEMRGPMCMRDVIM